MNRSSLRRHCARCFCFLFASFFLPFTSSHAQIINVRTAPLLAGEQFGLAPSARASMGNVSIAYEDPWQEPFINPAKARRLQHGYGFTSPAWNHWSYTMPQPIFFDFSPPNPSAEIFGSHLVSLPVGQIGHAENQSSGLFFALQVLNERSSGDFTAFNIPLVGLWARDIPNTNFALGIGIDLAYLDGVEGVSFLYPGFDNLNQEGAIYNFRLGVAGSLSEKDEINFLAMQHNYVAHHEANGAVENKDRNHGWLASVEYRRALTPSLRGGVQLTGNWKTHPKIPDYPLSGVPRDPGTTHAYNFGAGMAWQTPVALFALDAIYEPVDFKTWVEAEAPVCKQKFSNSIIITRTFSPAKSVG